jgi:hypothetical protein
MLGGKARRYPEYPKDACTAQSRDDYVFIARQGPLAWQGVVWHLHPAALEVGCTARLMLMDVQCDSNSTKYCKFKYIGIVAMLSW